MDTVWMLAVLAMGFLTGSAVTCAVLGTAVLMDDDDDEVSISDMRRRELVNVVRVLWGMAVIMVAACAAVVWRT